MSFLARSTLLRVAPRLLRRPALVRPTLLTARTAASSVTHKPPSENLSHAVTNAAEEASATVVEVAKKIAGTSDGLSTKDSFASVTGAIASQVPQPIMVLGLAGALPYLGTSLTTVYLAREAGLAAQGLVAGVNPTTAVAVLNSCLDIQVTYGAVLLSFLGAIHWGFEFASYGGSKGYKRLVLGMSPVLVAWSTLALSPMTALITQWVGFTSLWYADMKVTGAGWTPLWYSQYRFYLSLLVGTCIIGTVAGNNFLGPVAGHSITSHKLEELAIDRANRRVESEGQVGGDVEAVSTGEIGDSYVLIRKVSKQEDDGAAEKAISDEETKEK